jgi:hypothetical protein
MAALISNVRYLIGDVYADGNASQTFPDQEVQDTLDKYVTRYSTVSLPYEISYTSGATMQYLTYLTPDGAGDWEADVLLQATNYTTITPASSDLIKGVWVLSVSTPPPVYLTGKSYDCFATAAFLCREWAALVKLHFDATDSGVSMQRHQKYDMLIALAKTYEAKRRAYGIKMNRHDLGRPQKSQQQENWQWRVSSRTPR